MCRGFDAIGRHSREGRKVVQDARELGGEALHLLIRDCDPRQPRDVEDISSRKCHEGQGTTGRFTARVDRWHPFVTLVWLRGALRTVRGRAIQLGGCAA